MRKVVFGLVLAMAAMGLAQEKDKVKLEVASKDGDTVKHSLEMDFDVQGTVAKLVAKTVRKVKKVSSSGIDMTLDYEDFKVTVDDQEFPVPFSQLTYSVSPSGEIKDIAGGVEGTDNARTSLIVMFIAPEKELATGEKWTLESKGNDKVGIPAYKYEATFVGKEKVGEEDAWKYTTTLGEIGSSGLNSKGTWWVTKTGKILKADLEFQNLPIPQAGADSNGKVRLSIIKS